MLRIVKARISYPDGSHYEIPKDGTWAEAPPFGVQAVVYYHVPDESKLFTHDGGEDSGDVYIWMGENSHPDYAGIKMGLWQDREGFYRVQNLATGRTSPEV